MKLFKSGQEPNKTPAPTGAAAASAAPSPLAAQQPFAAPAGAPPAQSAPGPGTAGGAAPAAAPPPPADPEITAILDANVKEMSDKIAKLSRSLESTETEKVQFEQKIEQMEERMRKLSALTEMISAQYNPFVGDAPGEREPLPMPEVGLAAPPAAAPAMAPPMMAPVEEPAPPAAAPFELPPADPMPSYDDARAPAAAMPAFPEPYEEAEDTADAHVWSIARGFESSMLMLGWADMLLKNLPSRDSLADVVNYYHNIGWIGDPARDQLLAYADGIATVANDGEARPDWRASVDIHEKSLLFLEKLKAISARGGRGGR